MTSPRDNMTNALQKLDAVLWDLYSSNKLNDDESTSVIVKCARGKLSDVSVIVRELGGHVQRSVSSLSMIVAWVPSNRIVGLAQQEAVLEISYEGECAVA